VAERKTAEGKKEAAKSAVYCGCCTRRTTEKEEVQKAEMEGILIVLDRQRENLMRL
jgi:hypothetical protein